MAGSATPLSAALADRYRIDRELGRGGMATVYLAEDLKHDRKVALKVLRPELGAVVGGDRFLAEIRTTAHLQHPHILPLFDSGEAGGFLFYVMPYVEGESLRHRLDREKQLPADEAVRIGTEVASALDYAHRHGVIHRDIKPANILLEDGHALVADFGIALAVSHAGGTRLTETGVSPGTPSYMSPEQALGEREITARSDVYALGCVVYEMLTGEPPHTGGTAQAVLGKIIAEPPLPVTQLRKSVSPNVQGAVARALEKVPADRFGSAAEFARALNDPAFRHGIEDDAITTARGWAWNRLSVATTITAGVFAIGLAVSLIVNLSRPTLPRGEIRFSVVTDSEVYVGGRPGMSWGRPSTNSLTLSPDGQLLVYAGSKVGSKLSVPSQLYSRRLDQERSAPIPGTDGASSPFFSPDGTWIGFFAGGSLKRLAVPGGNVETIAPDAQLSPRGVRGATWGDDGTIVYGGKLGLYRVSASGGTPYLIVKAPGNASGSGPDSAGYPWYGAPQELPGGHALLFHRLAGIDPKTAELVVLDLESGKETNVLDDAMDPLFVPPDRLLFMRQGTLMAVGFDPSGPRLVGEPHAVVSDVMQAVNMPNLLYETGAAQVALSRSGDLAWVGGGIFPPFSSVVFEIAPDGRATSLDWDPANTSALFLRASPRGNRVAYVGPERTLYVRDLARGVSARHNTGGMPASNPVWSPDGDSLLFSAFRNGIWNVYRIAADGSGPPVRLVPSDANQIPLTWSARGAIAYTEVRNGAFDIWTISPGGNPRRFVATNASERYGTFSPDGHWLAYVSDASGHNEVYVKSYPEGGGAIQISGNGGISPAWSPDGRRIYYIEWDGKGGAIKAVDVLSRRPFRVGSPHTHVRPWPYLWTIVTRNYDVLADGSFLVSGPPSLIDSLSNGRRAREIDPYTATAVHWYLNFISELRKKAR